jgi:hypothetical protein
MKIELLKEVGCDKTWYFTKVDGHLDHYFSSEEDAQKAYKALVENAKQPPVIELLKSEEI